jgi:hypothetical protein
MLSQKKLEGKGKALFSSLKLAWLTTVIVATRFFSLSLSSDYVSGGEPGLLLLHFFHDFRYPLIDGTFFLSPRQHTKACIQVEIN